MGQQEDMELDVKQEEELLEELIKQHLELDLLELLIQEVQEAVVEVLPTEVMLNQMEVQEAQEEEEATVVVLVTQLHQELQMVLEDY